MAAANFYTANDRCVLLRVKAKAHARDDRVLGARAGELLVYGARRGGEGQGQRGDHPVLELVMELEEEFDINIPDDAAEKIQTVGQAVDHIKNAVTSSETSAS